MTKKHRTKYIITGIFLFFFLATRVSAQQSLKDATLKYAAMQATKGAIERFKEKQIPEIKIPETPEHEVRSGSKNEIKKRVPDLLSESFDKDLNNIYLNIVKQSNIGYSKSEYKKEARERYAEDVNTNTSKIISEQFDDYFDRIRDKAVNQQLSRLTSVAYPLQNEVELADNKGWSEEAKTDLTNLIIEKYKGTAKVLFSENRDTAEPKAEKIIKAIIGQLKEQENALNSNTPNNAITQIQISKELSKNIQTTIFEMEKRANQDEKIYKIFPSVEKNILSKATLIEKERFKFFIKNFNFSVNNEMLKETIQSDLKSHRSYSKSLEILSKNLFPGAAEEVVNTYSDKIKSSSEYQDFENHLKQLISKNQEVRTNLKSAISNEIKTPLKKDIRPIISNVQLKRHFYPISSGEWAVPENILKKMAYKEYGVNSFEKCLTLPFINRGSEPYNRYSLLEETENEVLKKIGKLLSEGKRAWKGQEDIIRGKEKEIKNEEARLAKTINSLKSQSDIIDMKGFAEKKIDEVLVLKTEDQWVDYYTKQVEKEWGGKRFNKIWRGFNVPPPNSSTKYSPLFGYMKEEIKKIVHNFFKVINVKIETQQKKIEKQEREEEEKKQEEERRKREEEQRKLEEEKQSSAVEQKENPAIDGKQEGPTGGGEQEGPADIGGKVSVNNKESGQGPSLHPQLKGGGAEKTQWPWWMWILLILAIILIIGLLVWLILLYRKLRRLQNTGKSLPGKDFKKSVSGFSKITDSKPIWNSDNEAVFKRGAYTITFKKSD